MEKNAVPVDFAGVVCGYSPRRSVYLPFWPEEPAAATVRQPGGDLRRPADLRSAPPALGQWRPNCRPVPGREKEAPKAPPRGRSNWRTSPKRSDDQPRALRTARKKTLRQTRTATGSGRPEKEKSLEDRHGDFAPAPCLADLAGASFVSLSGDGPAGGYVSWARRRCGKPPLAKSDRGVKTLLSRRGAASEERHPLLQPRKDL